MTGGGGKDWTVEVLEKLRGKFIAFDGVDGTGKGTQIRLLTEALTAHGIGFATARDPGGTQIGDRIRHVLLDYDLSEMDVRCETFLFMASRAQLVREVIEPALAENQVCVGDRFVSATCAYQGAAGFDPLRVVELARFAIGDTWPALTIVLDLAPQTGFERTRRQSGSQRNKANAGRKGQQSLFPDVHTDAMEARQMAFHERVRQMSLELPGYYPAPVVIVDASGTIEQVRARVIEAVADAVF